MLPGRTHNLTIRRRGELIDEKTQPLKAGFSRFNFIGFLSREIYRLLGRLKVLDDVGEFFFAYSCDVT